jgi:hypothetical protein
MPTKFASLLVAILAISFCLPACSYMSAQGRREMAYRHYVNKSMKQREHRIAKATAAASHKMKRNMQPQVPSEPIVSSGAGPATEPMSAPITVSASENQATNSEPTP